MFFPSLHLCHLPCALGSRSLLGRPLFGEVRFQSGTAVLQGHLFRKLEWALFLFCRVACGHWPLSIDAWPSGASAQLLAPLPFASCLCPALPSGLLCLQLAQQVACSLPLIPSPAVFTHFSQASTPLSCLIFLSPHSLLRDAHEAYEALVVWLPPVL